MGLVEARPQRLRAAPADINLRIARQTIRQGLAKADDRRKQDDENGVAKNPHKSSAR